MRTALKIVDTVSPPKRITINLSPAYVRKCGSSFDLPVAVAVLAAMGIIPKDRLEQLLIVGEVGLDGRIKPIHGVLPIVTKGCTGADGRLYGAGGKCQRSCIGKRNPSVW